MTHALDITARAKAIVAAALTIIALSFATPAAFAQTQDPQGQTDISNTIPQQQSRRCRTRCVTRCRNTAASCSMQKYGEVWVPTVTPQGWHPYPPCNWVNTKQYGWYYDDKTPWGQIVHHYGRWVYDGQMGWIWTPGSEFSPAWVVWRTSPEWVCSAPMLPDEDVQKIAAADFNNAGYWIFVETPKFAQGCNGSIAPPSQVPVFLKQTTYVTDIQLVGGIVVFVLPSICHRSDCHHQHQFRTVAELVPRPGADRLEFHVEQPRACERGGLSELRAEADQACADQQRAEAAAGQQPTTDASTGSALRARGGGGPPIIIV